MGYTVYLYIASLGKIQYLDLSSSWTLMQGLMIIRKITSLWNCCFAFIFINNGRCIEITRTKNIRTVCKLSLVILREKVEKCTISFFNFCCFFLNNISFHVIEIENKRYLRMATYFLLNELLWFARRSIVSLLVWLVDISSINKSSAYWSVTP